MKKCLSHVHHCTSLPCPQAWAPACISKCISLMGRARSSRFPQTLTGWALSTFPISFYQATLTAGSCSFYQATLTGWHEASSNAPSTTQFSRAGQETAAPPMLLSWCSAGTQPAHAVLCPAARYARYHPSLSYAPLPSGYSTSPTLPNLLPCSHGHPAHGRPLLSHPQTGRPTRAGSFARYSGVRFASCSGTIATPTLAQWHTA